MVFELDSGLCFKARPRTRAQARGRVGAHTSHALPASVAARSRLLHYAAAAATASRAARLRLLIG